MWLLDRPSSYTTYVKSATVETTHKGMVFMHIHVCIYCYHHAYNKEPLIHTPVKKPKHEHFKLIYLSNC